MTTFALSFMRVDHDPDPTVVEGFFRTVDWPTLPHEGEGFELGRELDSATVESVGYDLSGYANIFLGRGVLDDLQAVQLRKLGRSANTVALCPNCHRRVHELEAGHDIETLTKQTSASLR